MIKALIVEDEDLAAQRLKAIIEEVAPTVSIIRRTTSIAETRDFLASTNVDLMFLDINLSDGFSFSIFNNKDFKTPPIIFTTAYSEYAIKAFELNSISYLLKPIKREELKKAIEKYNHHFSKTENNFHPEQISYLNEIFKKYKQKFLVKVNNRLTSVDIKSINYFYTEDKLTFIMLESGKSLPYEQSLKSIELEINPNDFFRINRKYLIHHRAIKEMYYSSKSKIKIELTPANKQDNQLNFIAIEKIGQFKKWLSK
ncbi:LytR/AlgR family response regulator transcription factor [Wenyingzhuangia sp. IMCC45574]